MRKTKQISWFTYGRYEGAHGGYIPPVGVAARVLYWIGNMVGRYSNERA